MKSATGRGTSIVLTLLMVAACGGGGADQETEETDATIEQPLETEAAVDAGDTVPEDIHGGWILVAIDGEPVPEPAETPTLELLPDGTAHGVGGINQFRSQFEIEDGRLTFGPAAATKMAGPPQAMKLEAEYLARLGAVSSFEVDGDTLRFWAGDNQALTFERKED